MQTISLREFQLHAGKYLDKLPVLLTRYNVVVAQVLPNGSGVISKELLAETYDKAVKPVVIKKKEEIKKVLETIEPEEHKPLGWCTFVSKEGRRCNHMATIYRRSGNVCDEHI